MNSAIAQKLATLLEESEGLKHEVADLERYTRWRLKAGAFLNATLGSEEAAAFDQLRKRLDVSHWLDFLALERGHLEGLLAKSDALDARPGLGGSQRPGSGENAMPPPSISANSRKVFIVHGHDNEGKESVARFIERLGLTPIILHEQPNSGRTIIEKFEMFSGDVAFAIVLLTPDDVGAAAGHEQTLKGRARQNVIMELGYFFGKLGRARCCALHKADVELPSDIQGIVYIEMDPHGAWKTKLAQELVEAKIGIQLDALLSG